jgi:hypothetical protein
MTCVKYMLAGITDLHHASGVVLVTTYAQVCTAFRHAHSQKKPADALHPCRAECMLQKGDSMQALAECDAALRADPKFVKALFRRAKARLQVHAAGGGFACGALCGARDDLMAALEIDEECQAARDLLKDVKSRCVWLPATQPHLPPAPPTHTRTIMLPVCWCCVAAIYTCANNPMKFLGFATYTPRPTSWAYACNCSVCGQGQPQNPSAHLALRDLNRRLHLAPRPWQGAGQHRSLT